MSVVSQVWNSCFLRVWEVGVRQGRDGNAKGLRVLLAEALRGGEVVVSPGSRRTRM